MKGKFIKKLTAYALTAAMVVSTPMTAFASEFADNFWYSDGSNPDGENENTQQGGPSGTGTVTVTQTTDLSQYDIGRIEIDPPSYVLDLENEKTKTLTVKVYDTAGKELSEKDAKVVCSQIEWTTSNYSIVRPTVDNAKGRENCLITGYKGGFATITAGVNVDPNRTGKTDTTDKEYAFVAKCLVMVKKAPKTISLKLPNDNKLYAGHTYDLTKYVTFDEDAFDAVDFNVTVDVSDRKNEKKKSLVTWSNDGVLAVDKKVKDTDGITLTIKATCQGNSAVTTTIENVDVKEGIPATGLSFDASSKAKAKYDIKSEYNDNGTKKDDYEYPVIKVTAKTKKGDATTDDITWSTSDSKIVRILAKDGKTPMNGKTEEIANPSNDREIRFQGMSVGKATITATTTSGKSAKLNVTVTATLIKIESAEIVGNATYTGKATPIVVKRIPAQNQSKLKINIPKDIKQIKGKAAITPILTPNAVLSKIVGGTSVDDKTIKISGLEVIPANKKEVNDNTTATIAEFTIKQSDVKLKDKAGVISSTGTNVIAQKTVKINSNRTVTYFADFDPSHPSTPNPGDEAVSWESSKETVAKIIGQGQIQIVGAGSAKITVSSVYEDKPGKYKTSKQSFTIKSTPKCEEIVLKTNLVTVDKAKLKKNKDVTINVKQQLPKMAADKIDWYTIGSDNKMVKMGAGDSPIVSAKTNDKKCTVTVKSDAAQNSVIRVVAVSSVDNRVQAEAKIVVK